MIWDISGTNSNFVQPVNELKWLVLLVIPVRLERTTYCLEGSCSIQLSYGTADLELPLGLSNLGASVKLAARRLVLGDGHSLEVLSIALHFAKGMLGIVLEK